MTFRPKYITFDCYGTLTNFRINDMPAKLYGEQLTGERLERFKKDFTAYRLDEAMGDWKPYDQVLKAALRRTCKRHGIAYSDEDGQACYEAVPTWGPHADVPEALTRVGREIPLVILSNAMNEQIHSNVRKLEAPFHKVYTAQDAGAYKPRLQAFEYMLDQLGCAPGEILHVSSSPRYDLMSAHDLGIVNKVFVNRNHEPKPNAAYTHVEIRDITGLPALVGL
ncbi:MAG TPA: haloacid dehalogenase type II [Ramlibacter sp.]|uniref:haloacid dehalogenase type II n=1 Tax=Ramlibacter sp. TaxID=1917967 RepID=UPI002B853FEA|nr:haloacid dehalogenase type II [Ramlibacter sp.]HVZ44861.1 haloacid dehalogenase type II [Ramlibacter sp.]